MKEIFKNLIVILIKRLKNPLFQKLNFIFLNKLLFAKQRFKKKSG